MSVNIALPRTPGCGNTAESRIRAFLVAVSPRRQPGAAHRQSWAVCSPRWHTLGRVHHAWPAMRERLAEEDLIRLGRRSRRPGRCGSRRLLGDRHRGACLLWPPPATPSAMAWCTSRTNRPVAVAAPGGSTSPRAAVTSPNGVCAAASQQLAHNRAHHHPGQRRAQRLPFLEPQRRVGSLLPSCAGVQMRSGSEEIR